MKAIILAAGLGTRLRPLTNKLPKPLLSINGKPLMLYHFPEKIRSFLGNGSKLEMEISYSLEPKIIGTAGAVRKAEAYFENKPFFVFYGDNLTNIGGAGIYILEPEILSFISLNIFYDFGKDLFPKLLAQEHYYDYFKNAVAS